MWTITPADICGAVDELVLHAVDSDTHALMLVNHYAYRVLEGGDRNAVASLRDSVVAFVETTAHGSIAHTHTVNLLKMVDDLQISYRLTPKTCK